MNRRIFMASVIATAGLSLPGRVFAQANGQPQIALDHPLQSAWQAWKSLCLAPEGRVIDAFQDNASHSEGQGYGLTLAAIFGDLAACDRIIRWTEQNLAVRPDALLAWRWQPDASPQVTDRNNASDGDLFYAWGLLLTSQLNGAPDHSERMRAIAVDLLRLCVVPHPDGSGAPLFLPGARGFVGDDGVVINPSYYMPRAFRDLADALQLPKLLTLADAGQKLVESLAAKGPVPDWILVTAAGIKAPPQPFSMLSGYEAMRVPLIALWSGEANARVVSVYADAVTASDLEAGAPTIIDPLSHRVTERSSHLGYAALGALASCVISGEIGSLMPAFSIDQPYYPATLHMMALVVQATTYQRCVPI